ncbi:MAG TPA: class I SAM-dependent methyltransferase [Acidimicrobiales bacterium]|nr:class I SAM-dependent methyltransferase [Acidimicrobiales bacterium]
MELPDPESLVAEQIAYYRARAPEYDHWWLRTGRYRPSGEFGRRWEAGKRDLEQAVLDLQPCGDVLELAAGTGNLTAALCRVAGHVTAVDASEEALSIARGKVDDPAKVTFVHADLFGWRPPRRYDTVAFGFWLSHVPVGHMARFWQLVDDVLRPGGRVFFADNAVPVEQAAAATDERPAGSAPATPWSRTWLDQGVSFRTLSDGRQFTIVKRGWTPAQLQEELAGLGWDATVHETQGLFIHGTAVRGASR